MGRLSELKTGEKAVIVKVLGHGGFRKRIIEMGFIKGQNVEVLLNAPLQDPVKYKVMGYEVSLRRQEAEMIEVVSKEDILPEKEAVGQRLILSDDELLHEKASRQRRVINIAFVGNPNCGKTSLFNFASGAHERVGNYSGVTVDAKEGYTQFEGYQLNLVDLPGTYSLSAYSPEELYVRKQIIEKTPDVIVNVIDSSNLERNLYLTTQLVDMHIRMVCALNMFDELEERGDQLDKDKLGELFGVPMVPTVFKTGKGVDQLFRTVIQMYESKEDDNPHFRHIHINHGHEIEDGISHIQTYLKNDISIRDRYSTRFLAIKLLEHDKDIERFVKTLADADRIIEARNNADKRVMEETKEDSETAIMDAKYGFIHGALRHPSDRRYYHAQMVGVPHLYPPALPDVSGHLLPRTIPDGLDRRPFRLAGRHHQRHDTRRSAQGYVGGRHHCRCRLRDRVPPTDSDTLHVYLADGRQRLYGSCGLYHG